MRTPDVGAACDYYSGLFGWEVADGVARLDGLAVAGIVGGSPSAWITCMTGPSGVHTDPFGAEFGLSGRVAELVNQPGSWDLSTLRTPDPAAAAAFYGWCAEPWGSITLLRLPGYVGGLSSQPVPRDTVAVAETGSPAEWLVDFRVSDAAAFGEVTESPGFRSVDLADPCGAKFTVTEFR